MNHNPYSAPTSEVADIEPDLTAARPRQVTIGLRILWFITIINAVFTVLSVIGQATLVAAGPMFAAVITISFVMIGIVFGLVFWFLWAAGKGRNWARIVLTVLMVIGILWVLFTTVMSFGAAPFRTLISVISLALQITAIVLLFVRESNAWYSRR